MCLIPAASAAFPESKAVFLAFPDPFPQAKATALEPSRRSIVIWDWGADMVVYGEGSREIHASMTRDFSNSRIANNE